MYIRIKVKAELLAVPGERVNIKIFSKSSSFSMPVSGFSKANGSPELVMLSKSP